MAHLFTTEIIQRISFVVLFPENNGVITESGSEYLRMNFSMRLVCKKWRFVLPNFAQLIQMNAFPFINEPMWISRAQQLLQRVSPHPDSILIFKEEPMPIRYPIRLAYVAPDKKLKMYRKDGMLNHKVGLTLLTATPVLSCPGYVVPGDKVYRSMKFRVAPHQYLHLKEPRLYDKLYKTSGKNEPHVHFKKRTPPPVIHDAEFCYCRRK